MFRKVLIVEDTDYISSAIKTVLEDLKVSKYDYARYCDDAFTKVLNADKNKAPFDLIISDLSFVNIPEKDKLISGEDFIKKIRTLQPNIKVIVFSIEDKPYRVQYLCKELKVNAFVWKSIHGQLELKKAIESVYDGEFFISEHVSGAIKNKQTTEITDYDILLLSLIAEGIPQVKISEQLKEQTDEPSSISSIEKRLKFLKEAFNAKNPTHLIAITKDLGLI